MNSDKYNKVTAAVTLPAKAYERTISPLPPSITVMSSAEIEARSDSDGVTLNLHFLNLDGTITGQVTEIRVLRSAFKELCKLAVSLE